MLKSRVQQAFNRAAETYSGAADIQRRVADALAERLRPATPPQRIVDAGCGTGFALPLLHRRWPQAQLVAVDLAERMLTQLRHEAADTAAAALCGDLEHLPLAAASADLYWSSLSLQWCALPQALREARRVLRPGGTLAVATLASDTFHELRAAFAGIDRHAHTLDFLAPEAIGAAVAAAGFPTVTIARERLVAGHADLKSLLRAVRRVGAGEVAGERRRGLLGKAAWSRIEAAYPRCPGSPLRPLTYDVLYVVSSA